MSDVDNSKMLALLRGLPTQPPAIDISEYSKPSHVAGRVVVITGGNAGLGYAAAEHFAKLKPARLIISSRNQEKGDKAAESLCLVLQNTFFRHNLLLGLYRIETLHWVRCC